MKDNWSASTFEDYPPKKPLGHVDDIKRVAKFIAWHSSDTVYGDVRADEAWQSLCKILSVSPDRLSALIDTD